MHPLILRIVAPLRQTPVAGVAGAIAGAVSDCAGLSDVKVRLVNIRADGLEYEIRAVSTEPNPDNLRHGVLCAIADALSGARTPASFH